MVCLSATPPPCFPGDEDVPHVQHGQHQRRVQAEGGGEAGGEADGPLRSTGRPADAALPRHLGQHQERRETRPTLQCQKDREDEREGEDGKVNEAASGCSTCCDSRRWSLMNDV